MSSKRRSAVSIFIPISILSDVPSLVEKTFKVGQIARSASIFRVDRIVIYKDSPSSSQEDAFLIRDLLSYAETPQYLRRLIFPIIPRLRYAGMIPPLRTPHHPLAGESPPFREGFVLKSGRRRSRVEIGLNEPVEIEEELPEGGRVTLHQGGGGWTAVPRSEVPLYWGYETRLESKTLSKILRNDRFGYVIGTSRLGSPLSAVSREVLRAMEGAGEIAILFGSPAEGLDQIMAREGLRLGDYADVVMNTVPGQGTATVRTEEAVAITLAVITAIEASGIGAPKDR